MKNINLNGIFAFTLRNVDILNFLVNNYEVQGLILAKFEAPITNLQILLFKNAVNETRLFSKVLFNMPFTKFLLI